MSDQNKSEPIIVAEAKVKDPKRVAAGKRLGAISKQRKEEKRETLRLEQREAENNKYTLYFVGGLAVAGAAYYLYLNKDKLLSQKIFQTTTPESPASATQPATSPPKRKSKRIFGE